MSTKRELELVIEKGEQILEQTIKKADPELCQAFNHILRDYILMSEQHLNAVLDEIYRLMKKYGGTYEMTIGAKTERTIKEDCDATIWLALLDELREMNETQKFFNDKSHGS